MLILCFGTDKVHGEQRVKLGQRVIKGPSCVAALTTDVFHAAFQTGMFQRDS